MPKNKNKTKSEIQAENRILRRFQASVGIWSFATAGVQWVGLVLIARYGFLTVNALAGEATSADIGIKLLADVRVSEALAWLLATGGVIYGRQQRGLRRTTVERLQGRIVGLEKGLDSGRSSSGLTPRGETRPGDEP